MYSGNEEMVVCPYNKYHVMTRKRLQPHLVQCRISHPSTELCTCPFNSSHLIPEPEFTIHVTNCPDKSLITQYKYNAAPLKTEEDKEEYKCNEIGCDDNWDETEAKDYNPTEYVTKANIIRAHVGNVPSARKAFRKVERKRLGDGSSSDEEDEKKPALKSEKEEEEEEDIEESFAESLRRYAEERDLPIDMPADEDTPYEEFPNNRRPRNRQDRPYNRPMGGSRPNQNIRRPDNNLYSRDRTVPNQNYTDKYNLDEDHYYRSDQDFAPRQPNFKRPFYRRF